MLNLTSLDIHIKGVTGNNGIIQTEESGHARISIVINNYNIEINSDIMMFKV